MDDDQEYEPYWDDATEWEKDQLVGEDQDDDPGLLNSELEIY